jgi:replication initiation protein RepC
MTGTLPTTSFGRRTPSLAQLAAETRTKLEAGRASEPVHKWRLYRTLTEAKAAFGLPDGTLTVLQALLAFHTETALTLDSKDPSIVVFPSNRELSIRANGVPESTLRRHLARLVAVGLIARRDSPNGKRFARRGGEGETTAFGFDLAPFIASKGRIEAAAAQIRAHAARLRMLREKITLLRRDCAGAIAALGEAGAEQVEEFAAELARLSAPIRRAPREKVEACAGDLEVLADRLDTVLAAIGITVVNEEIGGFGAQNERYIQNQNQTAHDSEPASEKAGGESGVTPAPVRTFPLSLIVRTFPTLADYARGGRIGRAGDLVDAANLARSALGVSPDAWRDAQEAMGQGDAAIAVAAMLERAGEITSAGGYLRALTAKARAGEFSTGPLVMAQMKRNAAA